MERYLERPANDVQIWDKWNSTYRQGRLDEPSKVRLRTIGKTMEELKIRDAKILEAGCGTGWLSDRLSEFGKVTGVDLGSKILETAQRDYPHVDFRSGDVHTLDLPADYFDVIVTSEVLSHVPDQRVFIHRLAELLKPGGFLLITSQNKFVFERTENISPPDGWIRQWVTMKTLKSLLREDFSIRRATTLEPEGHLGVLRIINSRKVNRFCNSMFGAPRIKQWKESAGFGQSLFVVATKH
jgi:2-polyprenyl-3-methyl-5-hydroxy-6-metoxy-1,4-benzoquinol methylase